MYELPMLGVGCNSASTLASFLAMQQAGVQLGFLCKHAAVPEKANSLTGQLVLSKSGWLLLNVPNSLLRGAYLALDEPGIELPLRVGLLWAHITVMDPDEIKAIGGASRLTERGKHFRYNLGPVYSVEPAGWTGVANVWYLKVDSPELETLRKSYGLLPKRKGYDFHITVAVRKRGVLQNNSVSKAS